MNTYTYDHEFGKEFVKAIFIKGYSNYIGAHLSCLVPEGPLFIKSKQPGGKPLNSVRITLRQNFKKMAVRIKPI